MEAKKVFEIIEFTDPVCTWCWGSEPLLRKLEVLYENQVKISFVMGGLVKDIRDFYDPRNGIGGNADLSNHKIADHWIEASRIHGMPVKSKDFSLFSNEHPSSYPQNIAFKAAQLESEEKAIKLLRRMREATEVESKQTNRLEVLVELASQVGLDIDKFIKSYSDGSAEKEFYKDMEIAKSYRVQGFPSFLIKCGGKEKLLYGFQRYESIKSIIEEMSESSILPISIEKSDEAVINFIEKFERVAAVEIMETFEYSKEEFSAVIYRLINKNKIMAFAAGNGVMFEISQNRR